MKLIKEVDRPTGKFYEITEKGKKVLDILESLRSLLCSQETMIKGVTK
jgi:predicted transcriptional regulator